jgi:hypothetical protein
MDVGKELKEKLWMRICLVSERQSVWHQERVDIRTGDSGLEENEDASKPTAHVFSVGRTFVVDNMFGIAGSLLTRTAMSDGLFLSSGDWDQLCARAVE